MRTKLVLAAALLATAIASPAFAGSSNDDQTTAAKLDEVTYQANDDQTTAAKLDEVSYQTNDDQTTAAKLDEVSYQTNDDQTTAAKLDEVVFRGGTLGIAPRLVDYSDDPDRTGGGSSGYNSHVRHDYTV
jgi:hypothetical protein